MNDTKHHSRFTAGADGKMIDRNTGLPPTEADHAAGDAAHRAMMEAESAFEQALKARYGKRAGDARYRLDLPEDIKVLALAFQDAVTAWRATWLQSEVK